MRLPRFSPARYQRITLGALVALAVIIVTGAAVRLTGSGLGCPEWPTCEEGSVVAPLEFHAWVEFGNRLFTGVVSVAVILAVLGSLLRVPRRRDLTLLSLGLVAGVIAQIVIGAIVVLTHLVPAAVSVHFLVSMLLIWNALVLSLRAGQPEGTPRLVVPRRIRDLARGIWVVAVAVLFTGTLVTGAGPHSGDPGEVERLAIEIRDIVRVHAVLVIALLALTFATVVLVIRSAGIPTRIRRRGLLLVLALVLQAAIGYTQYFTGVPALLVGAHVLGAVLVWTAVVAFYCGLFTREPALAAPVPHPTPEARRVPADAAG